MQASIIETSPDEQVLFFTSSDNGGNLTVAAPFKHYRFHGCPSPSTIIDNHHQIETSRLDGDVATDSSLAG